MVSTSIDSITESTITLQKRAIFFLKSKLTDFSDLQTSISGFNPSSISVLTEC